MNNSIHSPVANKDLGQNFLTNTTIVDKLTKAADISADDTVIEVGPGKGIITKELAKIAGHVYAIDLDANLIALAKENTREFENIDFIHRDILTFDLKKMHQPYKVIGAIPYNITSPIIHKFLTTTIRPVSMTLIIQKEVAEKIVAQPPHAAYLSMFVASQGEATIIKNNIPPGTFSPPPKVNSAIIHIALSPVSSRISAIDLSAFLHEGFKYPRKMLRTVFEEENLKQVDISAQQRPAEVTLDQWLRLFEIVRK